MGAVGLMAWQGAPTKTLPVRPLTDFALVEARYAPPSEADAKTLERLQQRVKAGGITAEEGQKREMAIRNSLPLVLLGYLGDEPRAFAVKRADAEAATWTPEYIPTGIQFETVQSPRSEKEVWNTPVTPLGRKGWIMTSVQHLPTEKYIIHPWTDQARVQPVSIEQKLAVMQIEYRPRQSSPIDTAFGPCLVEDYPSCWVVSVMVTNPHAGALRGYFDVLTTGGVLLGNTEIRDPLAPGESREEKIVLRSDPKALSEIVIKSVAAILERVGGGPPASTSGAAKP